jgi:hypothetical protein
MKEYIKHMVECNCSLPQFSKVKPPVFHKFIVFSVISENGNLEPSFAECNHCGAIHKVIEVGKTEQLKRETMFGLEKIEEIKTTLPEPVAKLLEAYKVDLPTWQEVKFIYTHEKWGKPVILSKEEQDGVVLGKYLLIVGKDLYKVDSFFANEES